MNKNNYGFAYHFFLFGIFLFFMNSTLILFDNMITIDVYRIVFCISLFITSLSVFLYEES